ncbi:MAG TPA: O-antigen ligase family protein [Candidatus Saccharimonadales bacterium]
MKHIYASLSRLVVGFMGLTVVVIITLMPYHAFLSTWLGTQIGPLLLWKLWKEALLLLAVVVAAGFGVARPSLAKQLLKSPLTLLILAFTALHFLLALLYRQPVEPTLAGLMTNLRFLALFLIAQLVVLAMPAAAERLKHFLALGLLVSAAIVSVLAIIQTVFLPANFLETFGYNKDITIAPYTLLDEQEGALRAFATLRGPNALGQFLLLPLGLIVALLWRRIIKLKVGIPLLGLMLAALVLSGSRSAWAGAFITFAVVGLILLGRSRFAKMTRSYGLVALAFAVTLLIAALEYPPLRLAVFHSSPGDPTLIEGSTEQHLQATASGAQDALLHPLGRGPGQAGPASFYSAEPRIAENYYVQLAQEVGLIGLGLFIGILVLVGRKLWQQAVKANAPPLTIALLASFWGMAVINMLLHGWADDPSALIWWGLAGLALTLDNKSYGSTNKITTTVT